MQTMRNTMPRMGFGVLCLLALTGPQTVRADDAKPDAAKPITMTQALKAKDTVQYKNVTTINAGGADIVVEQNRKYTVKEVKDTGEVVVSITDLGGKFTNNGADQEIPPGPPVAMTQ